MAYAWSRAGEEDQSSKIGGTLVAQSTSSIDQGCNTVGLQRTAHKGASPSCNSTSGLLGLQELLLGVCSLGALVGVTEDRSKDAQRGSVREDSSQRDRGGLHGR
jgi:hypothetical protein